MIFYRKRYTYNNLLDLNRLIVILCENSIKSYMASNKHLRLGLKDLMLKWLDFIPSICDL